MQTMKIPAHETVGHKLPVWETKVDRKRQECFHNAAAVSGAPFGDLVDVSVLSNDCLHGARPRDALGAKRLHVGVRVKQNAAISLGEPMEVHAQVDNIRPDRRGRYIHIRFCFRQLDGTIPVEIDHQSLILDPCPDPPVTTNKKPASLEFEPEFEVRRRIQMTPEMVSGYSFEFPHLKAHHDPKAAAAIGMRAPIAQGLMGFTLLMSELAQNGLPPRFEVEARFKRPIFWDDELALEYDGKRLLRAVNAENKIASELHIYDWE